MAKNKRNIYFLGAYSVCTLFRLLVPFLLFILPAYSIMLTLILDMVDGEFASRNALTVDEYEKLDKFLDLWWYTGAMVYSIVMSLPFLQLLIVLYIWRLVGELLYFKTNNRILLFIFANYFENIFIAIYVSLAVPAIFSFMLSGEYLVLLFGSAIVLKIIQEWWIHVQKRSIVEVLTGRPKGWFVKTLSRL